MLPPDCKRLLRVFIACDENCYMPIQLIPPVDFYAIRAQSNEPLVGFPGVCTVIGKEMFLYPLPSQEWEIARTWESPEGHLVDAVRDTD